MDTPSPLTLLALAAACAAVGAAVLVPTSATSPAPPLPSASGAAAATPGAAACPPGSLPDEGVCVPVPRPEPSGRGADPTGPEIPRRPERGAPLSGYRLPVETAAPGGGSLPAGLAAHPDEPRGGTFIEAPFRAGVSAPQLEGQHGDAEVLMAVDLFGPTVVTRHRVSEAGRERDYVLFTGNLDALPDTKPGPARGLLGHAGSAASGGSPGVYLELRRARAGFDVDGARVDELRASSNTVTVDLRNLLPPR